MSEKTAPKKSTERKRKSTGFAVSKSCSESEGAVKHTQVLGSALSAPLAPEDGQKTNSKEDGGNDADDRERRLVSATVIGLLAPLAIDLTDGWLLPYPKTDDQPGLDACREQAYYKEGQVSFQLGPFACVVSRC